MLVPFDCGVHACNQHAEGISLCYFGLLHVRLKSRRHFKKRFLGPLKKNLPWGALWTRTLFSEVAATDLLVHGFLRCSLVDFRMGPNSNQARLLSEFFFYVEIPIDS